MPKLSITFKKDETAKSFIRQFAGLSLSAKASLVKGDKPKVVIDTSDEDEEQMVRSLIANLKEETYRNESSKQLIESVASCMAENKSRNLLLRDNTIARLTPTMAKSFVAIHDQLSEENQTAIRRLVIDSNTAFKQVMEFCKQRSKSNGII